MKILPVKSPQAAKPCPSPVVIWRMLLSRLLDQHYGLTLNDTLFSDDSVIERHIDAGITLIDALNFIVERYELARIDRKTVNQHEPVPYLTATDIIKAYRDLGLFNHSELMQSHRYF